MCAELVVVESVAGDNSRLWFPQHLHKSTHLRSPLRGFQAIVEEDAKEG